MPLLGQKTKPRKYEHIGPYGLGAGFAIGSGDRLAARRREKAQIKAFTRRYPGMLPHAMNAVASGMFGNGQSVANPDAFGSLRQGIGLDRFDTSGWDPTVTLPHPFPRSQFQSTSAFPPSGGPAFIRQPQFPWPAAEGIHRSQSMCRPWGAEGFLEELYVRRQPDDDYLDAYDGFGMTHFPCPFTDYHRGSVGPPHNDPLGSHRYHGSTVAGDNVRFDRPFSARRDRRDPFDPPRPQAHSWRGSSRHSYERLRPEDL
jgi:hypothetical protein